MALKTCIVSYYDLDFRHSVEVVAETLFEAVVLGIKAMKVKNDSIYIKSFDVEVKEPSVYHQISGAALNAWLAMPGKTGTEDALKQRLKEVLRS